MADTAVRHLTREIVDPVGAISRGAGTPRSAPSAIEPELPLELRQELHRRAYESWADEPVPALDDRTPRQAVRTEAGRKKVERLLRSYEASERRRASRSGEEAMDFDFLREAVGLKSRG